MRIVVVSDTHRDFRTLLQIVEKHKGEADRKSTRLNSSH